MANPRSLSSLQSKIWEGSVPLEIRLASSDCRTFDQSDPYLVFEPYEFTFTRNWHADLAPGPMPPPILHPFSLVSAPCFLFSSSDQS
jgi:autophagy-related protein 5